MLAVELDPKKFQVSVYEKNPALARKFLVAGDGGLNLSHSEDPRQFISRYTPSAFLEVPFAHFSNHDLVEWIKTLGVKTYIGTSGRVFPIVGIKPVEVLNCFLEKIKHNKVELVTRHSFHDFSSSGHLIIETNDQQKEINADLVIFALGGASWPVTGSSGDWAGAFKKKKIKINPFRPSNCSFRINWPSDLVSAIEGRTLKNIVISCGEKKHSGEVVLTRMGLEGSGIYPLSGPIRAQLQEKGAADLQVDFKPTLTADKVLAKIKTIPAGKNMSDHLKRQLNLTATQVQLLKYSMTKEQYLDPEQLAEGIKRVKLVVSGTGPIEDAISTVGGIALEEIDEYFQLKKLPGHYAIGEMLDYDAPTGGYLLQSCFTMAKYLADHLNLKHF